MRNAETDSESYFQSISRSVTGIAIDTSVTSEPMYDIYIYT